MPNEANNPNAHASELLYESQQRLPADSDWWTRYISSPLNMSETAKRILELDSEYIVDRGIFGDGTPGPEWSRPVRRGLVMGSVQSGKTSSMLGVLAKTLDRQADVVVLLAGTRTSLWKQTYARLIRDLDGGSTTLDQRQRRVLVPNVSPANIEKGSTSLSTLYQVPPAQVRRTLLNRKPIIVVAMKQADHLRALGRSLRDNVYPAVEALGRAAHMVIFDDEADDGSVLDARVESSIDPVFGALKQIPRAIADLWSPRIKQAPGNLFASYVAYTATPQANFLQEDQNPLYPHEFVVSLRTPSDSGSVQTRSSSYLEPNGLDNYYTGGTAFYERGQEAGLTSPTQGDRFTDLADALRAFLVAGAIRLIRSGGELGPASAASASFISAAQAREMCPSPHSMLIHPSAQISDHFSTADEILRWAAGGDETIEGRPNGASGQRLPQALASLIGMEEEKWAAWAEEYRRSAQSISLTYSTPSVPTVPDWEQIRDVLVSEIIPGTRLSIINSDPLADDSVSFEPYESGPIWRAPRHLSTIFIAGNVMSRGITLEGLTTTLFLRDSNQPLADSQSQMQRWFGYRGDYLDLCRLFASSEQLQLFANYHDVDEGLRVSILSRMNDGQPAPRPSVLQGADFLATGKIANLGIMPLCPGSQPLIRLVNPGDRPDPNTEVLAGLFGSRSSSGVAAAGIDRGRVLDEPLTLTDAANVLDALRYDRYRPGMHSWQASLWDNVQLRVEEQGTLAYRGGLYRPAAPPFNEDPDPVRKDCPYAFGAYLRLWDACLTRRVRGLFPTESPSLPWSAVDLQARQVQQPRFWVAIRYGGGPLVEDGPLGLLDFKIPAAARSLEDGRLSGPWGSQMPSAAPHQYRGDQYLDYYHRQEPIITTVAGDRTWRPVGADGLILFYVNQPDGQPYPTIITGVCFPLGGPDQFATSLNSY